MALSELDQAAATSEAVIADLRAALGKASALEALILTPLIADARRLHDSIRALQLAASQGD